MYEFKWIDEIFNLVKLNIRWDMVMFYDYLDKYSEYCEYFDLLKNKNKKIIVFYFGSRYWKIVLSICVIYIMKVRVFDRIKIILKLVIYDYKLFLIFIKIFRIRFFLFIFVFLIYCMVFLLLFLINWDDL